MLHGHKLIGVHLEDCIIYCDIKINHMINDYYWNSALFFRSVNIT